MVRRVGGVGEPGGAGRGALVGAAALRARRVLGAAHGARVLRRVGLRAVRARPGRRARARLCAVPRRARIRGAAAPREAVRPARRVHGADLGLREGWVASGRAADDGGTGGGLGCGCVLSCYREQSLESSFCFRDFQRHGGYSSGLSQVLET